MAAGCFGLLNGPESAGETGMVGATEGGREKGQGVPVWSLGQFNGVGRAEVMWEWCECPRILIL